MKAKLACLFLVLVCVSAQFGNVAFGADDIPIFKIRMVALVAENKITEEKTELSRSFIASPNLFWMFIENCKRTVDKFTKRSGVSDWDYACCPVTADGVVHCESRLGR